MLADQEIQLTPYLHILARRWRVGGALFALTVLTAMAFTFFFLPPVYEARAGVAVIRAQSQINFDPRFQTFSQEYWTGWEDREARQKGLLALASSSVVATEVISQVGHLLEPEERKPDVVLGYVAAEDQGDLIEIVAQAETPEKAAALANAWAQAYENHVNSLYGSIPRLADDISAQWAATRGEYEEAEAALTAFIANSQVISLTQALNYQQSRLADAYETQLRVERLLNDATAFREQLRGTDGTVPASFQAILSDLLLRAEAATLASEQGNPAPRFQITLDSSANQIVSISQLTAQLDLLIATLEARRGEVRVVIESPALQAELHRLQEQLEREQARERQLRSARDVAWETYTILSRKVAEADVASQVRDVVVKFASPAVPPEWPAGPSKVLTLILAVVVGGLIGVAGSFVMDQVDRWRLAD